MADRERQRRFEALLREHQRIIFKVAGVYARNVSDRDDLAQDIATQMWRSFASFDERRAKFSTWMYRVALNVAISHVRTGARRDAARSQPLESADFEAVADSGVTQFERIESDERSAALHAFIGSLDPLNRALVLLYLEERSYAEIAEVLGVSETNVATKLNRIKQKLRGQMAAQQPAGARNGTR
ncbi:MAG: RNA polymerase sigma factor [Rhodanobacteraceae bacterium]